jgi:two-component system, NarL family, response regulator DegU
MSLLTKNDILIINVSPNTKDLSYSLERLRERGVRIVCWLESEADEDQVNVYFKQGFWGYFVGEVETTEFLQCIHHLLNNKPYLHSRLSSLLLKEYRKELTKTKKIDKITSTAKEHYRLSDREWEVLLFMAKGYSNKRIAENLTLYESTVKNHVSAILRKLRVTDRTAAVVFAIKNKWVTY